MASATQAGTLRVYATEPNGHRHLVYQFRNGGAISAGGSPDGVLANKTVDTQVFVPKKLPLMAGGWKVQMTLALDATDGLDASDSYIELPVSIQGAGVRHLNAADLGYTVDYPAASPAGVELPIGPGHSIPNGEIAVIGGAHCVISIENDT
jgi:hypothetical protein